MKVWILLFLLVASVAAPTARAASWAERKQGCQKFLRMPLAQQKKFARPTGYSVNRVKQACRDLVSGRIDTTPKYTNPAWYGQECSVTRDCSAGWSCIRRMCKPASYGGCDTGINACPAGESCVNGACR
jgi:hypothetical protein